MTEDNNNNNNETITTEKNPIPDANNTGDLMRPPKHIKDKTIFYKYSGYLKDLLGEEKTNGSMG